MSAIVLLCTGFGYAETEIIYWSDEEIAVLDRSLDNLIGPDYFTESSDITAFAVDGDIYLTQIDLPLFFYFTGGQVDCFSEIIKAEIKLSNHYDKEIWSKSVDIDPNEETKIKFPPIQLLAYVLYDFEVNLPYNLTYTFSGAYKVHSFEIQSRLDDDEPVLIDFDYGNVLDANIDVVGDRKASIGMIKRLHFNRNPTEDGILYDFE